MRSLGRVVARRATLVVLGWIVLVVLGYAAAVGGLFGDGLFDRLTSGDLQLDSESTQGRDLLAATSPTGPAYQLLLDDVDPADPQLSAALADARADLGALPGVSAVADPVVAGPGFVATDGRAVLVTVALDRDLADEAEVAASDGVVARLSVVDDDVAGSA